MRRGSGPSSVASSAARSAGPKFPHTDECNICAQRASNDVRASMRRILIAVLLCGGIAQSAAADSVTLRYGQIPSTVRSGTALCLFIAQQRGFFAREELKIGARATTARGDKVETALDQGAVDVTQT